MIVINFVYEYDSGKMKNQNIGATIKKLRAENGMSQELLAEESGLSVRTIQRIEKGVSIPNGDTCRKLTAVFKIDIKDLLGVNSKKGVNFLKSLNLSALAFVFFPLLGILIPSLLWVTKRDKVKGIDEIAKSIINFEITWFILLFGIPYFVTPIFYLFLELLLGVFNYNIFLQHNHWNDAIVVWIIMYLINIIFIIYNTFRIHDEKSVKYYPSVRFLRG